MKLDDWLTGNTELLAKAGITSARLDCLVLLEDATGKDRAWLFAHPEYNVKGRTFHTLQQQIKRRTQHEPLAYIRGKSEFYGRGFSVNAHTLQPRPETETMIELLQSLVESYKLKVESQKTPSHKPATKNQKPKTGQRLHGSDAVQGEAEQRTESYLAYDEGVAEASTQQRAERTVSTSSLADWQDSSTMTIVDVGTGSGCIAITAKLELPTATVVATDIDKKCVEIAQLNAEKLAADIAIYQGSLLEPLANLSAVSTYAESGADLSLSSGVSRINNTMHEQHKGKSDSGPQTNNKIASPAGEQIVGNTLILLANLPYVPDGHTINQAAMHEPRHAIFGGADGLDYYRTLFEQASKLNQLPKYIFTEALPPQHEKLTSIANTHDYQQIDFSDFIQIFSPKTDTNSL